MKFVMLPMCVHDVILKMNFLAESKTVIDLREGMFLLWSEFLEPEEYDTDRRPVRLACHHVTLPPRSAVLVP